MSREFVHCSGMSKLHSSQFHDQDTLSMTSENLLGGRRSTKKCSRNTGKVKCTPSSPKNYSCTGQKKNHTRVFLTQKKKKKKKKKKHTHTHKKNIHVPPLITVRMVRSYFGRVQSPCPCVHEACEHKPASRHISWSRSPGATTGRWGWGGG